MDIYGIGVPRRIAKTEIDRVDVRMLAVHNVDVYIGFPSRSSDPHAGLCASRSEVHLAFCIIPPVVKFHRISCPSSYAIPEYVRRLQGAVMRKDGTLLELCLSMDPEDIPGGQRIIAAGITDVSHGWKWRVCRGEQRAARQSQLASLGCCWVQGTFRVAFAAASSWIQDAPHPRFLMSMNHKASLDTCTDQADAQSSNRGVAQDPRAHGGLHTNHDEPDLSPVSRLVSSCSDAIDPVARRVAIPSHLGVVADVSLQADIEEACPSGGRNRLPPVVRSLGTEMLSYMRAVGAGDPIKASRHFRGAFR